MLREPDMMAFLGGNAVINTFSAAQRMYRRKKFHLQEATSEINKYNVGVLNLRRLQFTWEISLMKRIKWPIKLKQSIKSLSDIMDT